MTIRYTTMRYATMTKTSFDDDTLHYAALRYDNKTRYPMEENKRTRNFRNYPVWQIAVEYATKVYKTTAEMPWFEKKGLCDQLQRAAVSIGSNIAEGSAKPSDAEFAKFLDTSLGSAYEVETQLTIAHNIGYISDDIFSNLLNEVQSIEKQLTAFIRSIRKSS